MCIEHTSLFFYSFGSFFFISIWSFRVLRIYHLSGMNFDGFLAFAQWPTQNISLLRHWWCFNPLFLFPTQIKFPQSHSSNQHRRHISCVNIRINQIISYNRGSGKIAIKTSLTGNWDLAIKSNNSMTFHCVWNWMNSLELHNAHPDIVILPYDIYLFRMWPHRNQ